MNDILANKIAAGEVVEKNLKLALGLLDIVLEIDSAYHLISDLGLKDS